MQATTFDRRDILGAWLVVGFALATIGIISPLAARQADPGLAVGGGQLRPAARALSVSDAMPLPYDAEDFAEWLARHRGTEIAAGPTDADW